MTCSSASSARTVWRSFGQTAATLFDGNPPVKLQHAWRVENVRMLRDFDRLMAVPVAVGAHHQKLDAGAPVPLFRTRLASGANMPGGAQSKQQYAVAVDGRLLMNMAVAGATAPPISVVLNWDAALKR
jgi:hypothetical protein